jgi:hypothetical protein
VTVDASDEGGGIYRGVVEVDGAALFDGILADNDGKCVDAIPGNGDLYEFLDPRPCKSSLNATMSVDTTKIPDGDHTVRVVIVDASGNAATVFQTNDFRVENGLDAQRGTLNGSGASEVATLTAEFAQNGRHRLTVPYGKRLIIKGRLVNEHDLGIAGAQLDVIGRSLASGAHRTKLQSVRTTPSGAFRIVLPPSGPSRAMRIEYRARVGDAREAASTSLTMRVQAGLRFRITPRHAHNGQVLRFEGRLLGRPLPRGGKLIEIRVLLSSGWQTFKTVRTDRAGYFHATHRLRRSLFPAVYKFRARSRQEASYPYITGTSGVVGVRVA